MTDGPVDHTLATTPGEASGSAHVPEATTVIIEDGVYPRILRRPLDLARFVLALLVTAPVRADDLSGAQRLWLAGQKTKAVEQVEQDALDSSTVEVHKVIVSEIGHDKNRTVSVAPGNSFDQGSEVKFFAVVLACTGVEAAQLE
mgnify:CR=1 FL=1